MRQIIHIPDSKEDVIKHLRSQPNMSRYVAMLIEKDLKNQPLTKDDVIKLIKQHVDLGSFEPNKNDDLEILDSVFNSISSLR